MDISFIFYIWLFPLRPPWGLSRSGLSQIGPSSRNIDLCVIDMWSDQIYVPIYLKRLNSSRPRVLFLKYSNRDFGTIPLRCPLHPRPLRPRPSPNTHTRNTISNRIYVSFKVLLYVETLEYDLWCMRVNTLYKSTFVSFLVMFTHSFQQINVQSYH